MLMKFKDIKNYLEKKGIPCWESEDGQCLVVQACAFDDEDHDQSNFFDYGEPAKVPYCYTQNKMLQRLFNDPRIIILDCSECCGCAGW